MLTCLLNNIGHNNFTLFLLETGKICSISLFSFRTTAVAAVLLLKQHKQRISSGKYAGLLNLQIAPCSMYIICFQKFP